MKIEWECSECDEINTTNMNQWKRVKDGQGFAADCIECGLTIDVNIEVQTATV